MKKLILASLIASLLVGVIYSSVYAEKVLIRAQRMTERVSSKGRLIVADALFKEMSTKSGQTSITYYDEVTGKAETGVLCNDFVYQGIANQVEDTPVNYIATLPQPVVFTMLHTDASKSSCIQSIELKPGWNRVSTQRDNYSITMLSTPNILVDKKNQISLEVKKNNLVAVNTDVHIKIYGRVCKALCAPGDISYLTFNETYKTNNEGKINFNYTDERVNTNTVIMHTYIVDKLGFEDLFNQDFTLNTSRSFLGTVFQPLYIILAIAFLVVILSLVLLYLLVIKKKKNVPADLQVIKEPVAHSKSDHTDEKKQE